LLENSLRPGAYIVADDAGRSPGFLARVRSPANGYLSVPFGGDVELSMRLGWYCAAADHPSEAESVAQSEVAGKLSNLEGKPEHEQLGLLF